MQQPTPFLLLGAGFAAAAAVRMRKQPAPAKLKLASEEEQPPTGPGSQQQGRSASWEAGSAGASTLQDQPSADAAMAAGELEQGDVLSEGAVQVKQETKGLPLQLLTSPQWQWYLEGSFPWAAAALPLPPLPDGQRNSSRADAEAGEQGSGVQQHAAQLDVEQQHQRSEGCESGRAGAVAEEEAGARPAANAGGSTDCSTDAGQSSDSDKEGRRSGGSSSDGSSSDGTSGGSGDASSTSSGGSSDGSSGGGSSSDGSSSGGGGSSDDNGGSDEESWEEGGDASSSGAGTEPSSSSDEEEEPPGDQGGEAVEEHGQVPWPGGGGSRSPAARLAAQVAGQLSAPAATDQEAVAPGSHAMPRYAWMCTAPRDTLAGGVQAAAAARVAQLGRAAAPSIGHPPAAASGAPPGQPFVTFSRPKQEGRCWLPVQNGPAGAGTGAPLRELHRALAGGPATLTGQQPEGSDVEMDEAAEQQQQQMTTHMRQDTAQREAAQALLGMADSPTGTSSMEGDSAGGEGEEAPQPSAAAQHLGAWEELPGQAGAGRSFARKIQQLSQGQSVPKAVFQVLGVAPASGKVLLWDGGSGRSWEVGVTWDTSGQRFHKRDFGTVAEALRLEVGSWLVLGQAPRASRAGPLPRIAVRNGGKGTRPVPAAAERQAPSQGRTVGLQEAAAGAAAQAPTRQGQQGQQLEQEQHAEHVQTRGMKRAQQAVGSHGFASDTLPGPAGRSGAEETRSSKRPRHAGVDGRAAAGRQGQAPAGPQACSPETSYVHTLTDKQVEAGRLHFIGDSAERLGVAVGQSRPVLLRLEHEPDAFTTCTLYHNSSTRQYLIQGAAFHALLNGQQAASGTRVRVWRDPTPASTGVAAHMPRLILRFEPAASPAARQQQQRQQQQAQQQGAGVERQGKQEAGGAAQQARQGTVGQQPGRRTCGLWRLATVQGIARQAGLPASEASALNVAWLQTASLPAGADITGALHRAAERAAAAEGNEAGAGSEGSGSMAGPAAAVRLLQVLLSPELGPGASGEAAAARNACFAMLCSLQQALEDAGLPPAQLSQLEAAWLLRLSPVQRPPVHRAILRAAGLGEAGPLVAAMLGALQQGQPAHEQPYQGLSALQAALEAVPGLSPAQIAQLEAAWFNMGYEQQDALGGMITQAAQLPGAAAVQALEQLLPLALLFPQLGAGSAQQGGDGYRELLDLQRVLSAARVAAAEAVRFQAAFLAMAAAQRQSILRALQRPWLAAGSDEGMDGPQLQPGAGEGRPVWAAAVRQLASLALHSPGPDQGAEPASDSWQMLCELQGWWEEDVQLPPGLLTQVELLWLGLREEGDRRAIHGAFEGAHAAGSMRAVLEAFAQFAQSQGML